MIEHAAGTSILGRAIEKGCINLNITNIRDFSANRHMRVDDYPYGGGAGMVIEAEPVFRAVNFAKEKSGQDARVIYMTPQARVLDQTMAEELANSQSLILLCGHYEGIDERVLEEVVTDYVSIGDYVLTGGELPALVLMDAVSRFVPGVLSNDESSQFESIQDNLLEYPHYTRPAIWHEKAVPEVLLCGDHVKINSWRYEKSLERTLERRPDLLENSKKTHVIYMGSDELQSFALEVSAAVSRYAEILNYNRRKLQRQERAFTDKDMVVFVTDDAELLKDAADVIRNIRADNTPAFIVSYEAKAPDAPSAKELLLSHGLRLLGCYEVSDENKREAMAALVPDIRRKIGRKG